VVRNPPDPFVAAESLRSLLRSEGGARLRQLLEEVARSESFLPAAVARDALTGIERAR
jgi:hypothetical protein